jgi:hypothetical protein
MLLTNNSSNLQKWPITNQKYVAEPSQLSSRQPICHISDTCGRARDEAASLATGKERFINVHLNEFSVFLLRGAGRRWRER